MTERPDLYRVAQLLTQAQGPDLQFTVEGNSDEAVLAIRAPGASSRRAFVRLSGGYWFSVATDTGFGHFQINDDSTFSEALAIGAELRDVGVAYVRHGGVIRRMGLFRCRYLVISGTNPPFTFARIHGQPVSATAE